jgi:hypothetical protein
MIVRSENTAVGRALHNKIFYEYIFLRRHRENETTEC